jgi:hypothetical protein
MSPEPLLTVPPRTNARDGNITRAPPDCTSYLSKIFAIVVVMRREYSTPGLHVSGGCLFNISLFYILFRTI